MRKHSLRLFIISAAALAVFAVAAIAVSVALTGKAVDDGLVSVADFVENACLGGADIDDIVEYADEGAPDMRITFIAKDGAVIADSSPWNSSENHIDRPEVEDALSKGEGFAERRSDTDGGNMNYYARLIELPGYGEVVLRVATPGSATKDALAAFYKEKVDALSEEIRQLKKNNVAYIMAELFSFGLAVVALVVYCVRDFSSQWLVAALAMLAVYAVVRRADVKNAARIDRRRRLHAVYAKELKYLVGDFTCFGGGSRYKDPGHAFTFDMDVFGHDSLYNRINRTVTTGGGDTLAEWLGSLLPGRAEVERRREAIAELAGMEQWRSAFLAKGLRTAADGDGDDGRIDSNSILRAVGEISAKHIAPKAGQGWTLAVAVAALVCFIALIVLSAVGLVPATLAVLWGVVQMFVVIGLNSKSIHNISRAVEKMHVHMQAYIGLIEHIVKAGFAAGELKRLQAALTEDNGSAPASFGQLSEILKSLDRRGNFIGLILFNMFAMSDYFLVRRFLKWLDGRVPFQRAGSH